ncbi:MAG: glycosyltransferase [Pseudomonadota bacterium]
MKLLTFSTLYPNSEKQHHGIFTQTSLRHLLVHPEVKAKVVAPIPWFPLKNARFGQYAYFARASRRQTRLGIDIVHPRFLLIPKIGMVLTPFLMAMAVKPAIQRIIDDGFDFDVIDAHYFYPDGVAAIMLGRHFKKPVVIKALGTDLNLILQSALPRRMILWAAKHAAGMSSVCEALKTELVKLGVASDRVTVLRNGVDLELFKPVDRVAMRRQLGFTDFTLLSVGLLTPRKAHDLIIRALPLLPDVRLVIAGGGADLKLLTELAIELNVATRVQFVGGLPQQELRNYYGAADALVLASSREGWANVLLESMACGTPVVASNVWGTPEVVSTPEAGVLMRERTPRGIADGVDALRANYPSNESTRAYAERFSWEEPTRLQLAMFERILGKTETASDA